MDALAEVSLKRFSLVNSFLVKIRFNLDFLVLLYQDKRTRKI